MTVASRVKGRHQDIQKIERDMMELAQLFQDMEALVVQQDPAVTQIEQKGEEVTDNVGKANVEIDGAISKARSRNRKKWWCLLICRECRVCAIFESTRANSIMQCSSSSLLWLSSWLLFSLPGSKLPLPRTVYLDLVNHLQEQPKLLIIETG